MRTFTMHRGIAVPRDSSVRITASILAGGMSGSEGRWSFRLPDIVDVPGRLESLFGKAGLTRDDIFDSTPFNGLCACGTPSGAAYYALRHNFSAERDDHPLAIEFTADIDYVYVDPRDFLCTAFQLWDRESDRHQVWQSGVLCGLFGSAIKRYFTSACRSTDQTYRIAMCNLAALDPGVVEAHFANAKVIAGRYGTRFCSAFFVRAPISSRHVTRVYPPTPEKEPAYDISLDDFLKGVGA